MKTEIELKPCPFCGGKAAISRTKESGTKAYCKDCYCKTVRYIGVLEEPEAEKEMATQVWNKRASGWVSVNDRLPDTDTMVIVAIYGSDMITIQESETLLDALNRSKKEFNRITMAFINEGYWCDTDGYPLMVTPSYWMPLPEPPEGESES